MQKGHLKILVIQASGIQIHRKEKRKKNFLFIDLQMKSSKNHAKKCQ